MEKDERKIILQKILDAYFTFRQPLPCDGYINQPRTTEEIQDDLAAMMDISKMDIMNYMTEHGYNPMSEQDGTVKWAIWRMI